MTLLRATARTLLASQFVVTGFKAVRDPQPFVAAAEPVAERWLPVIQKYAPEQVVDYIPTETATLVRAVGVLELVGGLALATGKGRRTGAVLLAISLIPATLAESPFWTRELPQDKERDKALFLKNVSLLGGVVLAARDTEGKPSLAWLAQSGTAALVKDTTRAGRRVAKNTSHLTDAALSGGAALVGTAVTQSRKTRRRAAKQLKAARSAAQKQAAAALAISAAANKKAKKKSKKSKAAKQDRVSSRQRRADAKQVKVNARQQKADARAFARQEKENAAQLKLQVKQQKQDAVQAKRDLKQQKKDEAAAAALAKQDQKLAQQAEKAALAAAAAAAKAEKKNRKLVDANIELGHN
ncbi:MAG TPA: DoxX family protein [Propionibacteriaceae bacterium]